MTDHKEQAPEVKLPTLGEPEWQGEINDWKIQQVLSGLLIPNQGLAKALARALREARAEIEKLRPPGYSFSDLHEAQETIDRLEVECERWATEGREALDEWKAFKDSQDHKEQAPVPEGKHDFRCPDGELDEVYIADASVHIERMDDTAFWIGIDCKGKPGLMINTGVHSGTWYFNVEVDSLEDPQFLAVKRPRKAAAVPRRKASDVERIARLEQALKTIADTVSLLPSVTGLSPVKRWEDIPLAIRDLQECYKSAARGRNGADLAAELAALHQDYDSLIDALRDAIGDELLRPHVDPVVGFVPHDLVSALTALKAKVARLEAPVSDADGMSVLSEFWPLSEEGTRSAVCMAEALKHWIATRVADPRKECPHCGPVCYGGAAHNAWRPITPETKWERGTELGMWFQGNEIHTPKWFQTEWPKGFPESDSRAEYWMRKGFTHFRRRNEPPHSGNTSSEEPK